jgi:hypothetical protein
MTSTAQFPPHDETAVPIGHVVSLVARDDLTAHLTRIYRYSNGYEFNLHIDIDTAKTQFRISKDAFDAPRRSGADRPDTAFILRAQFPSGVTTEADDPDYADPSAPVLSTIGGQNLYHQADMHYWLAPAEPIESIIFTVQWLIADIQF